VAEEPERSERPQYWLLPATGALLLAIVSLALMPDATCELHLYQGSGLAVLIMGGLAILFAATAGALGFIHRRTNPSAVDRANAIGIGVLAGGLLALLLLVAWGFVVLGDRSC